MFSVLCESWQPTPVLLPGESPWSEEPGELQAMGLKRVGHDSATKHSTVRISLKMDVQGIPWWSSGEDSTLSLPRAGVQSLVRELKAQVTRGGQKNKINKIRWTFISFFWVYMEWNLFLLEDILFNTTGNKEYMIIKKHFQGRKFGHECS